MLEQWERKGEAGNLAPFKGALIIFCAKSESPQISRIVTWSMHCFRPTFIAQLLGVKYFTCLWGHLKGELPRGYYYTSSSNNFFPRFYDLMLGLHLFSCRGVRSEQFVKGRNSLSSKHVCIWSSASTMTLEILEEG